MAETTLRSAGARGRGGGESVRIRDHLANVRTFLAWLRAGVVLFAIGYATVKFQVIESLPNLYVGILVSVAGWLTILIAGLNFWRQRQAIEAPAFKPSIVGNVVLSGLTAIAGVTVLVYLTRN